MNPTPLKLTLGSLLREHDASLRTLTTRLPQAAAGAADERLALSVERYLDGLGDRLRASEKLLRHLQLPTQLAADFISEKFAAEAAAARSAEVPEAVADLLLARTLLRLQHCQIAALGVLQAIAEELEEKTVLHFVRESLAQEIEAEESLSQVLEKLSSPKLLSSRRQTRGRHFTRIGIMKTSLPEQTESGAVGWGLLWLIGIPVPILLILFVLRGCT